MSFGAGHIFEMISRIKSNQSLKKRRKKYFDGDGIYIEKDKRKKIIISKVITEEEKRISELKLNALKKENRKKNIKILLISFGLAGLFFYLLYLYLSWVFL